VPAKGSTKLLMKLREAKRPGLDPGSLDGGGGGP
jgi:hypothetical protein